MCQVGDFGLVDAGEDFLQQRPGAGGGECVPERLGGHREAVGDIDPQWGECPVELSQRGVLAPDQGHVVYPQLSEPTYVLGCAQHNSLSSVDGVASPAAQLSRSRITQKTNRPVRTSTTSHTQSARWLDASWSRLIRNLLQPLVRDRAVIGQGQKSVSGPASVVVTVPPVGSFVPYRGSWAMWHGLW